MAQTFIDRLQKQMTYKITSYRTSSEPRGEIIVNCLNMIYNLKKNLFIYHLFLFVLVFAATRGLSLVAVSWGYSLVVSGLLSAVASLVVEHRLQVGRLQSLWHVGSAVAAHGLQSTGSVALAHGLCCSMACGVLLHQGSNPCLLYWQVDSLPLSHQGSPQYKYLQASTDCKPVLKRFLVDYHIFKNYLLIY